MSDWISAEERMPQATGKYLCAVKDKRGNIWTIASDWSLEMKSWFGDYEEIKNIVTHWMPLPDPPKEGCDTNGEAKKYTAEEIKELAKKAFEA